MADRLELVAIGLDHTTAGIGLRERVAFDGDDVATALAQLTDPRAGLLEQAAILSTCNRVEVYGAAPSPPASAALASFLARRRGVDRFELARALYVRRGDRVLCHLAATAAGMHSLVLGEAQIQGQVRGALDAALAAGTAGPELRRLFESAIAAARRVRADTGVGRGATSVPHAGVALVRARLGTLRDASVLLIGTGDAAELTARHVAKRGGPRALVVLGRDVARAERFARRHGGRALGADRLGEALARADVVFSARGSERPVVRRADVERALAAGRRRSADAPLQLVDLAVPRDVEPAVGRLAGVELHTVDDLRRVVARNLSQRGDHLPAAREIVVAEGHRFTRWLDRRAAPASGPARLAA
ncbi:MAG TPA: glutamyl-tRNA reductase [Baekduia sp.]